MGVFAHEDNPEDQIISLYNLYKSRRFCSSTPTLFNSGTPHSQLSSCYLYKVDDTIESIMYRGIAENAFLSKWAGGLGGSWTSVRGTGSHIAGTNGESQGVIPFLKMHNDQLCAVNQGGKRKGSGCAYLESWHCDILEFLELRKNTGDDRRRTHDMNTANWIPDLFMKRMEARENWTLFRSNEVSDLHDVYGQEFEDKYVAYEAKAEKGEIWGQTIPAIDLWKQMLKVLFETGHPWITFKDTCNIRSPQDHAGVIHSSNLCTEITLNTGADETAVCNLGSVVLDSHLKSDGSLDHEKLRETIHIAIRALDNVIDVNFYPTEAAKTSNMRHRPIGLGVMGLQNALFTKTFLSVLRKQLNLMMNSWKPFATTRTKHQVTWLMSVELIRVIGVPSGIVVFYRKIPLICWKKNAVSQLMCPSPAKWTGQLFAKKLRNMVCVTVMLLRLHPLPRFQI